MKQVYLPGWGNPHAIKVIESNGIKKVLVEGRPYLVWQCKDEASQRMAIVQLHELKLATRQEMAQIFGLHEKVIGRYLTNFARHGLEGLISQRSGPKERWKIKPRVRGKILLIALKQGVLEYKDIQKQLEEWGESVSVPSIRQVLLENGLVKEGISDLEAQIEQRDFFDGDNQDEQLYLSFGLVESRDNIESGNEVENKGDCESEHTGYDSCLGFEIKARRYYSPAQRIYLNQLERGDYNTYAGGLLFVPLLERYSYLPTIKKVVNIETYEGYSLEELCLTLFYFDTFNFHSMEDFKRAYPEEFGTLIGRSYSPSLFTLRRFLHRVKEQEVSEKLIDEFALLYLKKGLADWGVFYVDGHFYPYSGMYPISMGWHGVRKIPMKGSYNFMGADEKYTPWIFLVRSSREDLLRKIPEMIEKAKKIAKKAGVSQEEIENLIVVFDREGFSAELFRYLDGRDRDNQKRRVIFATWAKYTEKWVYDVDDEKFGKELTVTYKFQKPKKIRYFETDRAMKKYGKVRAIVVERETDKRRCAIYTNAEEEEIESEVFVQLLCHRWGEENLIKELVYKHLINYWPGYQTEDLEEQPLVDNPNLKKLKQKRTNLKTELSQLKSKFGDEVLEEMEKGASWDEADREEIKKKHILTLADIEKIRSEMTLLNQEIDELPEKIRFDEAHDGKKLVDLNYERKRFLDCIKVFSYNMKNKMCEMLLDHYDKEKELLPVLSKIVNRAGSVKLEDGKLKVCLRRFKNTTIDSAARELCEDLNKMKPVTLDKLRVPIHYGVV